MTTWIKGVLSTVLPVAPAAIGQGAREQEKKAKPKLVDVADGYFLVEEAKQWGINLVRKSPLDLDELRARMITHKTVRSHLADFYDLPEIVDEVTEKLVDVSRQDSRIKRLVG